MDIHQQLLLENDCYKEGRYITPLGIMVHSTGANNPNLRRYLPGDELIGYNTGGNHWNRPGLDVCVHGFIGKDLSGNVQIYQTLPWNMRGWHCAGSGNSTHIAFEICEDGLDDADYFWAVYDAAARLCAYLCIQYSLDASEVICHREGYELGIASCHADVKHWFPKFGVTMDDFRTAVAREIENRTAPQKSTSAESAAKDDNDNMQRYTYLSDIPTENDFQSVISTLMDIGVINGDGSDPAGNGDVIDLSTDQVRMLMFLYRGGAFDHKLIEKGLQPVVSVKKKYCTTEK